MGPLWLLTLLWSTSTIGRLLGLGAGGGSTITEVLSDFWPESALLIAVALRLEFPASFAVSGATAGFLFLMSNVSDRLTMTLASLRVCGIISPSLEL